MGFLKTIFSGVRPAYLIRAYIMSAVLFFLFRAVLRQGPQGHDTAMLIFCILSLILFPFAKLAWDELKAMLMGDNFFILPLFVMIFVKMAINMLLWSFAVLIAPLGMLWVWYRTRDQGPYHPAD